MHNGLELAFSKSSVYARFPPSFPASTFSVGRMARVSDLAAVSNRAGTPFLRVLCAGAGTTHACSCEATPPGFLHGAIRGQLDSRCPRCAFGKREHRVFCFREPELERRKN